MCKTHHTPINWRTERLSNSTMRGSPLRWGANPHRKRGTNYLLLTNWPIITSDQCCVRAKNIRHTIQISISHCCASFAKHKYKLLTFVAKSTTNAFYTAQNITVVSSKPQPQISAITLTTLLIPNTKHINKRLLRERVNKRATRGQHWTTQNTYLSVYSKHSARCL